MRRESTAHGRAGEAHVYASQASRMVGRRARPERATARASPPLCSLEGTVLGARRVGGAGSAPALFTNPIDRHSRVRSLLQIQYVKLKVNALWGIGEAEGVGRRRRA